MDTLINVCLFVCASILVYKFLLFPGGFNGQTKNLTECLNLPQCSSRKSTTGSGIGEMCRSFEMDLFIRNRI